MTFEFLIASHGAFDEDIDVLLMVLLSEALEANQYEFDDDDPLEMVQITHVRESDRQYQGADGAAHTLVGFTVELDDAGLSKAVIDDFAQSLVGFGPIHHAIRFEDPVLQDELADMGATIFRLEMKLRRVLSFIYLHAYPNGPYNLLQKDRVRTMPANVPEKGMREAMENQFFHLTFSDYIRLNRLRALDLEGLQEAILESDTLESLKAELLNAPIVHEGDVDLINDLQQLMDPIERMRNCVAHNRRPDTDTREDYAVAHPRLLERLDQYLARLEVENEPP